MLFDTKLHMLTNITFSPFFLHLSSVSYQFMIHLLGSTLKGSITKVTGYKLDGQDSITNMDTENLPLYIHIQEGSGAHPAFYPTGTTGSFPRDNTTEY